MGTDRLLLDFRNGVPAITAERASRCAEPMRPTFVKKMRRRAGRLASRSAQQRHLRRRRKRLV
jgi:hypothetical protein